MNREQFNEPFRMIGESEAFLDCLSRVSTVAPINRPVLLIGERGTGKELLAARLHYLSPRWDQPRHVINCGAFAKELLDAELFGYERGAFTGADRQKPGRFELAHGGTLFLDELGQAPLTLQEKLLRVVEYGEFDRLGGIQTQKVDVRLVAATNQDLPRLCEEGQFKRDLLDRLSFDVITIPPLRFRQEDIAPLARYFSRKMALELGYSHIPRLSPRALSQLKAYPWPGNVRELKNVVERLTVRHAGNALIETIDEAIFRPFDSAFNPLPLKRAANDPNPEDNRHHEATRHKDIHKNTLNLPQAMATLESSLIVEALKSSGFHLGQAAQVLGISYHQLRRLMEKHHIKRSLRS
jgi:psp operon transcriptional activator